MNLPPILFETLFQCSEFTVLTVLRVHCPEFGVNDSINSKYEKSSYASIIVYLSLFYYYHYFGGFLEIAAGFFLYILCTHFYGLIVKNFNKNHNTDESLGL